MLFYKDLLYFLNMLTEEQLNQTVSIEVNGEIISPSRFIKLKTSGILDKDHAVICTSLHKAIKED